MSLFNEALCEPYRAAFEQAAYSAYFISTIKRTGRGGPFELVADNPLPQAELMKRSTEAPWSYEREDISAMWFGFCLALEHKDKEEL